MSSSGPVQPSRQWRAASSLVMGFTGTLCRAFLFGLTKTEVIGLDRFIELLDQRKDVAGRERGLITVSNHVSILDDPLMWGVLPLRYSFNPENHRWSLASHDLCFQNKFTSAFFTLGQTLPVHRTKYSKHGGLFQPTMTQAIRLLSAQPFSPTSSDPNPNTATAAESSPSLSLKSPDLADPFSTGSLTYTTTGTDTFPAPSAYALRRHSWIHIFPEGFIHQHPSVRMRYFKWGIARLILEAEPLPTIVPIFVSGTEKIMHESRKFPRFLPRVGKRVVIKIGGEVDGEEVFGECRRRWKELVTLQTQRKALHVNGDGGVDADADAEKGLAMGELTEELKYGDEAVALRKEVTRLVRNEVLKVKRELGLPEEDPKCGLAETWVEEGPEREGRMRNGSWVRDP